MNDDITIELNKQLSKPTVNKQNKPYKSCKTMYLKLSTYIKPLPGMPFWGDINLFDSIITLLSSMKKLSEGINKYKYNDRNIDYIKFIMLTMLSERLNEYVFDESIRQMCIKYICKMSNFDVNSYTLKNVRGLIDELTFMLYEDLGTYILQSSDFIFPYEVTTGLQINGVKYLCGGVIYALIEGTITNDKKGEDDYIMGDYIVNPNDYICIYKNKPDVVYRCRDEIWYEYNISKSVYICYFPIHEMLMCSNIVFRKYIDLFECTYKHLINTQYYFYNVKSVKCIGDNVICVPIAMLCIRK